jgi:hypothetical protein
MWIEDYIEKLQLDGHDKRSKGDGHVGGDGDV